MHVAVNAELAAALGNLGYKGGMARENSRRNEEGWRGAVGVERPDDAVQAAARALLGEAEPRKHSPEPAAEGAHAFGLDGECDEIHSWDSLWALSCSPAAGQRGDPSAPGRSR